MDSYYMILVVPALILSLIAQISVKRSFNKYSDVFSQAGYSGRSAAEFLLRVAGISDVSIERVSGKLTDHYSPNEKVLRLSDSVHDSTSIAAIGVAAHEVGHAMQYANGYSMIKVRSAIIPISKIGSSLAVPLILIGFWIDMMGLAQLGVIFFGLAVLFQIVTLPVELDASRRALEALPQTGILMEHEVHGARKVLTAAAMTYVAAMLVSLMQLLRFVAIISRRR